MTLKKFTDWPIRELEQDPMIYLRGYLSYAPLNGHAKDFAPLFEKQYCKGFNLILYAGPAFKFMVDDLQKATGYKLRWTSSFVGIQQNVTEFKKLYTPVPWARKWDRKYPEYFSDKPLWKDANGHLKINGHNYGPLPSMPQLEQGINASVIYNPGFVGNDYIKYWWFDPLYPNDSGKWWYRKKEHYGKQPVATPGLSNHGWGISVDLHNDVFKNAKAVDWLANNMASYGFAREPNNENDRWHITYFKVTEVTSLVLEKISNEQKNLTINKVSSKWAPAPPGARPGAKAAGIGAPRPIPAPKTTPSSIAAPKKLYQITGGNNADTPNFYLENSSNSFSNNFLGFFERALQVSFDFALATIVEHRRLFSAEDTRTKMDVFIDSSGLRGPLFQLDAIDKAITFGAEDLRFVADGVPISESSTARYFKGWYEVLKVYAKDPTSIPISLLTYTWSDTAFFLYNFTDFFDRIKPRDPVFSYPSDSKYFSPDFKVVSKKTTEPSTIGGGAFGRQATVVGSKFTILPGLKNPDGLSPKIFRPAKPYNGSSDPGDFLTYDEFFEMMIHPMVGNFSFGLAAVFTAIASREGNLGENKIGIGVANGSEHLGFLQIRCKPEDTNSFDPKTGWFGTSLLWSVPYSINGEADLTKNNKRYGWEAFIKDENIIKQIRAKASSSSRSSQAAALSLININTPAFGGEYNAEDRKNASSYLADWARIPANQVWMMKSKFSLPSNYLEKQSTSIKLPYMPQVSIMKETVNPWNTRGVGFLLNPWNIGGENTWKQDADVNIAFNVLVNWFKQYGLFSETGSKPTTSQAETRALKELTDLSSYMEKGKKRSFNSWLLDID